MMLEQRREPIRSSAYLAGSRVQPCALQIVDVCQGGTDTTIPAHCRDETFGRSQKADDTSVIDSCFACHEVFDGRSHIKLSREDWLFYALRGLQRTLRSRVLRGIAIIALDIAKPAHERPVKARKPVEQRAKIQGRPMENAGRPIPQSKDPWGKSRKAKAKEAAST